MSVPRLRGTMRRSGRAKLSDDVAAQLKAHAIAAVEPRAEIARRFGVSASTVSAIAAGHARADVDPCPETLARLRAAKKEVA